MKNKYVEHSKISEAKFREIVKYFAADLTATLTAEFTGISRVTINRYYMEMRKIIYRQQCEIGRIEVGEVECDESYFGPRRVKGKRGRGAGGKTIVFGLFKRNGKVYTHIVPNAKADTLLPLIRAHAGEEVIVNTDGWASYDGLVDMGYKKHYRVNHGQNEFVRGNQHVNGIEGFWGFAKHRLAKFCGVDKAVFDLYLKECEYRFNLRGGGDVYHDLLQLFRKNPLFSVSEKND
ncbi:MAG: IS1595 family transposase [Oscillospiraceae bacterium]|jgi:transposase-like protein|nr:IS1595 family transposase [Oscillospiraceae bacterium]